jgi:hypothetical protein
MITIKGKEFDIDDRSMTLDENHLAEYITAWENGVPKWYKIIHNSKGAYIVLNGERYYVLVSAG